MTGAEMIAMERRRQVEEESYAPEADALYWHDGALARAAVCYALPEGDRWTHGVNAIPAYWPWGARFWKPTPGNRIRELVKAGALLAAEIDRLQSASRSPSRQRISPVRRLRRPRKRLPGKPRRDISPEVMPLRGVRLAYSSEMLATFTALRRLKDIAFAKNFLLRSRNGQ